MTTPVRRVLLGLPSIVLFPHDVSTVDVRREENVRALDAMAGPNIRVLVGALGLDERGKPDRDRVLPIGTLARIVSRTRLPEGGMRIVLQGIRRARVTLVSVDEDCLWAEPGIVESTTPEETIVRAELDRLRMHLAAVEEIDPGYTGELTAMIPLYTPDVERITDFAASTLPLEYSDRSRLLGEADPMARLAYLGEKVEEHLLRVRAGRSLDERVAGRIKRDVIRERLSALRDEIGETATHAREIERFRLKLDSLPLSESTRAAFEQELDLLGRCPFESPEAARIRSHLEWSLDLPWDDTRRAPSDLPFERVLATLSKSHVGLEDVKRRITEILAIRQLGGGSHGTVLCFLGPPGTGKSSMARAVAAALGRRFLTIPVGAMTHERELAGVSRRLDGASPGAILSGLHRCGEPDAVILLDEIDKLSLGGEGTSAGALLLLLDPEHNTEFIDNYVGVPFDLSRCLFLATANDVEELPETLLDRMEFLTFPGYTESEKYKIAREHLLPRARTHAGIEKRALKISPGALRSIIRGYTEEAGIRHLHRLLVSLSRKAAVEVVRGGDGLDVKKADLIHLLGPRTVEEDVQIRRPIVGVATGLAWTSAGGALLPIEALAIPGSGRMILTGQIGEIMRESVQTAVSYVRTRFGVLGLQHEILDRIDLHLHFPSAATPKDGPSAGVAIATALVSLLTGRAARHDVALTGETSLLGAVLPVGGLREKLLAAIRCGIPTAVVPARNADDVLRLPAEIRDNITLHMVDHVDQALERALLDKKSRRRTVGLPGAGPRKVARSTRGDSDVA